MTVYRECFKHLYDVERHRIAPTPAHYLRLHRLERPEPWQQDLIDEIWRTQPPINLYPDYAPFYERLSGFAGVPQENIVVGAGIESLIRDLVMLTCDPGDSFAYTWPTCAMFDVYAQVFGAKPRHIATDPGQPLTVWSLCHQLGVNTKLLVLPNPGQPVETWFDLKELRIIADRCQALGAVFAIDEAYYGFGAPTARQLALEYDNVVVLRSFSKCFGAAALRVGYALGSETAIKPLQAVRQSGEISGPSLHAASVLVDRWDSHVVPGINSVCEGRDWLRDMLNTRGIKARGRYANHVLIDLGGKALARHVACELEESGVRVKAGYPAPLDPHVLVTAGSKPLMERFFDAFRVAL